MAAEFIVQTTQDRRTRLITVAILSILIVGGAATALYLQPNWTFEWKWPEKITLPWMFLLSAMGGLFFIPIPIEFMFYTGVSTGSPPVLSIGVTVAGFALGNSVSYVIGWKLNKIVRSLLSAKKLFGLRRKVNKYGVYAILCLNMVPAPSPLLTFGLGIARYNFVRLFLFLMLGNITKLSAIVFFTTQFI